MPVRQAYQSLQTAQTSYLPIHDGKKSKFSFWDAIQISNALQEYSGLIFERNLGEGASFVVDLYRFDETTSEGSNLVAVKTAKVAPLISGDSSHAEIDLYCFLLEIQVLCHEPINKHPNIISVLGIDWRHTGSRVPIPLLIIEYSKYGNLSTFLHSHRGLGSSDKVKLCLDIARGLQMIHDCGIVHGDLKLANILVFDDDNGGFQAKIADFGCSITGYEPEDQMAYRGTRSYRAPELKENDTLLISDLQKCDIFAFGLCVWEILNDGEPYNGGSEELNLHVESGEFSLLEVFDKALDQILLPETGQLMKADTFLESRGEQAVKINTKEMFRKLVHHTTSLTRSTRYTIHEVVEMLSQAAPLKIASLDTKLIPTQFRRTSVGIWNFSIGENRTPRGAQKQAVIDLQNSYAIFEKKDKCHALLLLSTCYAHGYGVSVSSGEALRYILLAAEAGSISAQAVLPRIRAAIEELATYISPESSNSHRSAISALPPVAYQTLEAVEEYLSRYSNEQNYHARIMQWHEIMKEDVMRTHVIVTDNDGQEFEIQPRNRSAMRETLANIKNPMTAIITLTTEMQTRKGFLLQWIAVEGWIDILPSLVKDPAELHEVILNENPFGMVSNYGNLIIAASANGRLEVLRYLIENGGSAAPSTGGLSISSILNGLHFLFTFKDQEIEEASKLLVANGADPNLSSNFSPSLEFLADEFPLELSGPPLDIAIAVGDIRTVQILLNLGADPLLTSGPTFTKQEHSCLELAVALHVYEIVDLILDHLSKKAPESNVLPVYFKGLVHHVSGWIIGGKGMFWRWLLHGSEYRKACSKTIKICLKYGMSLESTIENDATPLHVVSSRNRCQIYVMEELLKSGADHSAQDSVGQTPLHQCAGAEWEPLDNAKMTETLIKYGADVNALDYTNSTPAHYHATSNSITSLGVLIKEGAKLDLKMQDGGTPLYSAIWNGSYEAVKLLLDQGVDMEDCVTHQDTKLNALGWAIAYGRTQIAELLINRGASIYQVDNGGTCLNIASWVFRPDLMRLLFHTYGSIFLKPEILNGMDKKRNTPLQGAASASIQSVHELLLAGADLEFRDVDNPQGRTAIAVSIESGRHDITKFMLEQGSNVFCRGPPEHKLWSFLSEAVYWCGRKHEFRPYLLSFIQLTRKWIDENDLLTVRDFAGRTVLQHAIFYGQTHAVEILLQVGANGMDVVGTPCENWDDEVWLSEEFEGMSCLEYAKKLRGFNEEEKSAWEEIVPWEFEGRDLEGIIALLGGDMLELVKEFGDEETI